MIKNRDFLTAFERVATLGTVHAAAKDLGLTQTAITQRLKALENELGTTLFLRSRRGMSLTDEGQTILQYHSALQELEMQFVSKLRGETRGETALTIVGPTSAIATRIAANCEKLYAKFPFLKLHLRSEDEANRIDELKRGLADLAVVSPHLVPNEMDSKMLKPDHYLLVASAKWKGRKLQEILETERVIDFYENDETTTQYLKQYDLLKLLKRSRIFVNENEALIRYFSLGIGFGTLTESVAESHIRSGRLISLNKGQTFDDPLALAWYPRRNKADYFLELIKSIT
jgi:LysR family transcriptional regulator (chromosome initiation inhibitor)